jgi:hypothetical protein
MQQLARLPFKRLRAGPRPALPEGAAEIRVREVPFPRGLCEPALEPARQERLEPRRYSAIMLEPSAEVLGAAPGSGPRQTLSAAMGPAEHHVIGDFRVELQTDCMQAVTIGLVWEIRPTNSEEFGASRSCPERWCSRR